MASHSSCERSDAEFLSQGTLCRAWHYLPEQGADTPTPCIVMAHGLGGTRDAGLEPYALRFAEAGYQVLLFDYRHFGASDGEPRQLLSVKRQLQDWQAAVAYACTLQAVDAQRIALWGSSFSGGHVAVTAANDPNIAAFSAQGPMMDGLAAVTNLLGYAGVGTVAKLTALGVTDQAKGLLGLAPVTLPLVGRPGELATMSSADAYDGYLAITPTGWKNEMSARLALTLALYRPIRHAKKIQCPGLIQVCMQDSVAPASAAIKLAEKLGDKATLKKYDIGHFDIYVGEDFEVAVADQLEFFSRVLMR